MKTEDRAELVRLAEELYAGPPDAFTEVRNAAAKELVQRWGADAKALAAEVKQLKKPSVAAWALNLLVRTETEQIDSVLGFAESLRAAAEALDGEGLRALTRQRRQLTSALATAARSHARDAGLRLSGAVVDQVEGMLTAAMLDPVAAQVVRTGRLLTAFTATGVSDLDIDTVVAVPEALDVVAVPRPASEQEPRPPALTVVEGGRAKVEKAQEALEEAQGEVARHQAVVTETGEAVEQLRARRLQLQGEADELRRRLAAIEEDVDELDDDLEDAQAAHDDATSELREASSAEESARDELARLQD